MAVVMLKAPAERVASAAEAMLREPREVALQS
jgi:hypothetical protein